MNREERKKSARRPIFFQDYPYYRHTFPKEYGTVGKRVNGGPTKGDLTRELKEYILNLRRQGKEFNGGQFIRRPITLSPQPSPSLSSGNELGISPTGSSGISEPSNHTNDAWRLHDDNGGAVFYEDDDAGSARPVAGSGTLSSSPFRSLLDEQEKVEHRKKVLSKLKPGLLSRPFMPGPNMPGPPSRPTYTPFRQTLGKRRRSTHR